jgi:hypothetical protein
MSADREEEFAPPEDINVGFTFIVNPNHQVDLYNLWAVFADYEDMPSYWKTPPTMPLPHPVYNADYHPGPAGKLKFSPPEL